MGSWSIIVPVFVGLAAIYFLLPNPRQAGTLTGGLLAAAAIVLGGWLLIRTGQAGVAAALFYLFSFVAVVSGGLLVTQSNPVRAALSFALVVLSVCGLFLLQAAPFLTAATTIVYAGAIIVTFLFVIMLAQQLGRSDADERSREPFLACLAGAVVVAAVLFALDQTFALQPPEEGVIQTVDAAGLKIQLERLLNAAGKASIDEIGAALGDDTLLQLNRQAAAAHGVPGGFEFAQHTRDVAANWVGWKTAGQAAQMKKALTDLATEGTAIALAFDSQGHAYMPGDNMTALGNTLLTTFLVPIELAGTLLLVATIGAIAIAARHTEELR
jgi:NADH:ubiquinone oxidoreductase subunit 6 (subunit J)